jgi:hypothetical protein
MQCGEPGTEVMGGKKLRQWHMRDPEALEDRTHSETTVI